LAREVSAAAQREPENGANVFLAQRLAGMYVFAATAHAQHGPRGESMPVGPGWMGIALDVERAADQVAAFAVAEERERCAKLAETVGKMDGAEVAAAIRGGGSPR
jgi:hypothetical protein